MLDRVKVGDKVKSCLRGWGNVTKVNEEHGNFIAKFSIDDVSWFLSDGRYRPHDAYPEIIEVEKKKWEPEGGVYVLVDTGHIDTKIIGCFREEGREYKTQKQAETAYKMIRPFQRLVAWTTENIENYDLDSKNNNYIVVKHDLEYEAIFIDTIKGFEVRMPRWVAKDLADKLNSGEVEL